MGGEGFEPPKAHANGFTVRPGSPTPASAHSNAKIKASDKYIFIQTKMQIFCIKTNNRQAYQCEWFVIFTEYGISSDESYTKSKSELSNLLVIYYNMSSMSPSFQTKF